eukprot:CAMPEP_0203964232 /NCGR_PEP_ID=MMETSP0359-20131031/94029_1 /ASSEMBLY_ACC=CAM_ASM_000338 /TAXON_ID=268821 /ORGANISM="Scrippsiella Hangoei, Strain SHTV-5" /LENGTH=51 /DNA_ID=CAMNT_0050900545 /DNA_START=88 /DNA_END=240 /DNA_ORIENTATION=-
MARNSSACFRGIDTDAKSEFGRGLPMAANRTDNQDGMPLPNSKATVHRWVI